MTRTRLIWFSFFALVLLGCLVAAYLVVRHPAPAALSESLATGGAPWPAETAHLKERLAAIGLPALAVEGTVLHTHQHLDLYIEGVPVRIPSGIGVYEKFPHFISPIHTHDETGTIHVESPTVETFTLGQFFDVWGVRLTDSCIGGYCAHASSTLAVFVNGTPYTGNPRDLPLEPHAEIVVSYGTPAQVPSPLPATYDFSEGY